jgi:hypothetical protein
MHLLKFVSRDYLNTNKVIFCISPYVSVSTTPSTVTSAINAGTSKKNVMDTHSTTFPFTLIIIIIIIIIII